MKRNLWKITGCKLCLIIVTISALIFMSCPGGPVDPPDQPDQPDDPPVRPPVISGENNMKLWYTSPLANNAHWLSQALPIGNGDLGAMFSGGIQRDRVQFNEKTLWDGHSADKQKGYQNFGNLYIDMVSHGATGYSGYRRELSIGDAVGTVSYTMDGVRYKREYFASFPDKVIVIRYTTEDSDATLSLTADFVDAHPHTNQSEVPSSNHEKTVSGNAIVFSGSLTTVSYAARLVVLNEGGTVSEDNGRIRVEDADEVIFLLAAATNYDLYSPTYTSGSVEIIRSSLAGITAAASQRSYDSLKKRHVDDYRSLYTRVTLDLGEPEPDIPTNELITNRESNYFAALYFQFGRYLMISSSRGTQVPNNLQGIWNDSNTQIWESDIHPNINIQMNYWPAEVTNLSECHLPLLNWIAAEATKPGGRWEQQAKETRITWDYSGGTGYTKPALPGWTVRTAANIFGWTGQEPSLVNNAWISLHLWQHFAYTLDYGFLQEKAWPTMKGACEFWLAYLIEGPEGTWEAPNGWSPEQGNWNKNLANGLIQNGVPFEQQLIWDLFDKTLKTIDILGIDDYDFYTELLDKFENLDRGLHYDPRPGYGHLVAEYKYTPPNMLELDPHHRHLSHLVGLFPGDIFHTTDEGLQFIDAARESLIARGTGGTGWSYAWKIAFWARLKDGDSARDIITEMLWVNPNTGHGENGGIYPNLFCAHPPFQIDGNFGFTAGVAEMLIQSHRDYIEVLPALPAEWSSGKYTGLKARGNFTVDLEWAGGRPTKCVVHSGSGGELNIRFGNVARSVRTRRGESHSITF